MKYVKGIWSNIRNSLMLFHKENPKVFPVLIFTNIIALVGIIALPILLTRWSWVDFTETGQIGDTINGIAGPFIALAAAALTFLAFYIQYKANKNQDKQFGDQNEQWEVERFESKFYSLIEIHRNNINELEIAGVRKGRKAFISMFNELKFSYHAVESFYRERHLKDMPNDIVPEEIRFNIAYLIFFFGIGPNSSDIVNDLIGEKYKPFFVRVDKYLEGYQAMWRIAKSKNEKIAVNTLTEIPFTLDIPYLPCNGHMSKLSHYVRNLFQLVKFVDDANDKVFERKDKYDYVATIRSQLSLHEQLLLYYNALSVLGKPWLDNPNYLKRYCLIKSLPIPLTKGFYKDPLLVLGKRSEFNDKDMFEWTEIKKRLT